MLDEVYTPADQVLLSAAPTLMQPLLGQLPPPALGGYRFVVGRRGLFAQARSRGIEACLSVAPSSHDLPYGDVIERVRLRQGRIPGRILDEILAEARAALPKEWACLILLDEGGQYRIHVPRVIQASRGHIQYATDDYDPEAVVVDLHTHGTGRAFFSGTDDHDDRVSGFQISVVLGQLDRPMPQCLMRVSIHGQMFPVRLALWSGMEDRLRLPELHNART